MPRPQVWTKELIIEGLERFYTEYSRYPTGPEFDQYPFLPNSKLIERRFGGLVSFRTELGHSISNYSSGTNRARISLDVGLRGREVENNLENKLVEKFGPAFVHIERRYSKLSKNRVDFYVFSPSGNFGIDIFYTETERSLWGNIDHKIPRYTHFPEEDTLIFACGNPNFDQSDIEGIISRHPNKQIPALVLSIDSLEKWIYTKTKYTLITVK